jgi:uncharacterized membrane protein
MLLIVQPCRAEPGKPPPYAKKQGVEQMTTTLSALYDNATDAQNAVRDLVNNGFSREHISVVASDAAGEYAQYEGETTPESETLDGAGTGAVLGGMAGLVVGLAALAIPGVGPVLAAGPIASALLAAGIGAGVGAAAGGLIGALVDMGVDEEQATYYAEGVRRGGTLITVQTEDHRVDEAMDILDSYDPIDLEERVSQWEEYGWEGYDPNADPYTVEEIERERERYGRR